MVWKCPKCERVFAREKQSHSCAVYPLENHFKNKDAIAKPLFERLLQKLKPIGKITVESPRCCIHLVNPDKPFTFGAAYALKDRIRIHFSLTREIKDPRIGASTKMSANRYLYSVDIKSENEIDQQLIDWFSEAYNSRSKLIKK